MSIAKNLSIDLLRSFVAVVDHNGFSQAGVVLGLSQPAVSLKLKRLEELVEAQLLDRSRRELRVTRSGQDLLRYARRMISLNDEALSALVGPALNGHIRLGIPNEFAVSYLPQVLGRFSREHPNLTLEVTCDLSKNLLAQLHRKELDLTVGVHKEPVTNTINTWKEDLRWVVASNCTYNNKGPLPLVVAPEGCVYRHRALSALGDQKIQSRVVYTGTSYNGIRAAVEAGLGVTVLAQSTIPENFIFAETDLGLPLLEPAYVAIHFEPDNSGDEIIHLIEYFRNAFKGNT
jgi:DNA-binding transcriptional LysR family regulator